MTMDRKEAKKILMEEGRYSFSVDHAKDICNAFEVEFDDSMIRTTLGYRECIDDPSKPRVNCTRLAEHIAKKLNVKPDEKQYSLACSMHGEGSYRDAISKAYAMNL